MRLPILDRFATYFEVGRIVNIDSALEAVEISTTEVSPPRDGLEILVLVDFHFPCERMICFTNVLYSNHSCDSSMPLHNNIHTTPLEPKGSNRENRSQYLHIISRPGRDCSLSRTAMPQTCRAFAPEVDPPPQPLPWCGRYELFYVILECSTSK